MENKKTTELFETLEDNGYIKGLVNLSKILKELGLTSSRPTLREYERKEIIPDRRNPSGDRFYSKEDVDQIIRIVAGRTETKK